jgi:hypothetical protein
MSGAGTQTWKRTAAAVFNRPVPSAAVVMAGR